MAKIVAVPHTVLKVKLPSRVSAARGGPSPYPVFTQQRQNSNVDFCFVLRQVLST